MTELLKLAPGAVVDKTGVWDISIERYHEQCCDGPSISSSGLRTIWSDSPAHYWATSALNPARVAQADNPAFSLGRLAHRVLLEGVAGLERDFAIRPRATTRRGLPTLTGSDPYATNVPPPASPSTSSSGASG